MPDQDAAGTIDAAEVRALDWGSITIGEMVETERQAGRSFSDLLKAGKATRMLVGLFLSELRYSDKPRSWSELGDLRISGASGSISASSPDGHPETSEA